MSNGPNGRGDALGDGFSLGAAPPPHPINEAVAVAITSRRFIACASLRRSGFFKRDASAEAAGTRASA
jgi:hypothetical protein